MKFGNEFWLILSREYISPNLFAVYPTAGTSVSTPQPGFMHPSPPLYLWTSVPPCFTGQARPQSGPLPTRSRLYLCCTSTPSLDSPPLWNSVPVYLPGIVDCHGSNSDVGFAVNQLSDNTVPFLSKNRKPSSQKMEYAACHTVPQYTTDKHS